jgi:hypothetical protein
MRVIPIDDFNDVILFEMQKLKNEGDLCVLTFGEIWGAAARAAENFSAPVDSHKQPIQFAVRLIETIELLKRIGYLEVERNSRKRIRLVRLTKAGKEHVSKLVFSNQQRCARV